MYTNIDALGARLSIPYVHTAHQEEADRNFGRTEWPRAFSSKLETQIGTPSIRKPIDSIPTERPTCT